MTEQAERVQRTPDLRLPWKASGLPYHRTVVYTYNNGDGLGDREGAIALVGTPCNHDGFQKEIAAYIVKACNEYPKLVELAEAVQAYASAVEREVIPEGDMTATTTWHHLTACLWDVQEKARSQLDAESK